MDTLKGLLAAHMINIPFENFDALLGRKVSLELPALQEKLVNSRRGGYCFEHATLFGAVLEELGFKVARHTARVIVMLPRTEAARAHMFLVVTLPEGKFVVDPGFGGFGPRVPVPLKEGAQVTAAGEKHWMTRDGRYWTLNFQNGDKAVNGWVTGLDEDNVIDFEVGNHYTSTHETSPFRKMLMVAVRTPEGRIGVMNRDVTIRTQRGEESLKLENRQALRRFLLERLNIDLPEAEQVRIASCPEWA